MSIRPILSLAVILGFLSFSAHAADATSGWNEIMAKKKVTVCAVPSYQPYSARDASGKWSGFTVDMAKDLANSLHVDLEFVETSFKTVVLDLQSGKCNVFFGFNATPERALAIDFAGPLYTLGFAALDRPGFTPKGDHWADLNDPSIRVCYAVGNSSEQQIKRFAPKSTQVALPKSDDCALAIMSGRADRYIDGVMGIIGARAKNAKLGQLHLMTPNYALPSYAGMRLDDGRFQKFVQRWAEYNRANGNINYWLTSSMESIGIKPDQIPAEVTF